MLRVVGQSSGMLRLAGTRRISITSSRLIQRERIDKTPEKQKPKPRFQSAPGIEFLPDNTGELSKFPP